MAAGKTEVVPVASRSEEHTSELQSLRHLVCRLLLEKKNRSNCTPMRACTFWPGNTSTFWASIKSHAVSPWLMPCMTIFFFNDTATTEIYTLSLHDALPI